MTFEADPITGMVTKICHGYSCIIHVGFGLPLPSSCFTDIRKYSMLLCSSTRLRSPVAGGRYRSSLAEGGPQKS